MIIIRGSVPENTGAPILARILNIADGDPLTQVQLTAVTYAIYDLNSATPATAVVSGSHTVADVIYNSLQTDDSWTADTTGYNFKYIIPGSVLTDGDHTYLYEVVFDPVSGENHMLIAEITALSMKSV